MSIVGGVSGGEVARALFPLPFYFVRFAHCALRPSGAALARPRASTHPEVDRRTAQQALAVPNGCHEGSGGFGAPGGPI